MALIHWWWWLFALSLHRIWFCAFEWINVIWLYRLFGLRSHYLSALYRMPLQPKIRIQLFPILYGGFYIETYIFGFVGSVLCVFWVVVVVVVATSSCSGERVTMIAYGI